MNEERRLGRSEGWEEERVFRESMINSFPTWYECFWSSRERVD